MKTKRSSLKKRLSITAALSFLLFGAGLYVSLRPSSDTGVRSVVYDTAHPRILPAQSPAPDLKQPVRGVMDSDSPPRAEYRTFNGKPLVQDFVIKAYWSDMQPSGPDQLITTDIDRQLAVAEETGAQIRLRVFAGRHSPDWVKRESGGALAWVEPTNGERFTIPRFWNDNFKTNWNNLMRKLSNKYDGNARVAEVTISRCMTTYAEPFMRQSANRENIAAIDKTGYTYGGDLACLRSSIDILSSTWPHTRATLAFNPFQGFDPPKGANTLADTLGIMKYCRETLGSRCIIANNSLRSMPMTDKYEEMYDAMKIAGPPMYLQTATPERIGDWQAALGKAVALGANSVELNAGYPQYDKVALARFNDQLKKNRYPLASTDTVAVVPKPVILTTPTTLQATATIAPASPPATPSTSSTTSNALPTITTTPSVVLSSAVTPTISGKVDVSVGSTRAVVKVLGITMSRDGSLDTTKLLNATHEVSVETDDGTLNGNIISSNPLSLWQTAYNYLFFAYHGNVGVVRLSLGIVISIFALAVVMLVWLFVNSRRMRKLLK